MDAKVITEHLKKLSDRVGVILSQTNPKALLGYGFCLGILTSHILLGSRGAAINSTVDAAINSTVETIEEAKKPLQSNSAWVLAVTLRFKTTKYKDDFRQLFEPLAKFVEENESETLSYMLSESDKVSTIQYN
jgi:hypothetical protein